MNNPIEFAQVDSPTKSVVYSYRPGDNKTSLIRSIRSPEGEWSEEILGTICTQFTTRIGLRLVEWANECQPEAVQVSSHGAGHYSVQMIRHGEIVGDYNLEVNQS